ncbi:MAG TPA: DNA starvation/stationary phase protection protein Dps [Blastocatellia bacterium]|nr:DNA starvation/stationary phase protection protein Dps [Blastocatellia bacterium]
MHQTKNEIPEEIRAAVIELLDGRLADSIDLKTQVKQAHWNVKGPNFIALHELFDKIAQSVEEYVDLIAERIVQLGGTARGTARQAAESSSLEEYPLEITEGRQHVEALSAVMARYGEEIRQALDQTDRAGDQVTTDILIEISRGMDMHLWFVEAHLQGAATEADSAGGSMPRKRVAKS